MRQARIAAEELLREYFGRCGQHAPAVLARELVEQIVVRNDRWQDRGHNEEARRILELACFDVDDLAENHVGITLTIQPLHHLDSLAGAPVYGAANPAKRKATICERTLAYEPLYRTTVMHELAHVLLHSAPRARALYYAPFSRRRPWHEREADEFMHIALLPQSVLELAVARIADLYRMNLTEAFVGANTRRGRWQWRARYFAALINTLCVSRHMIAIKLKKLGVFSQATLDYHLTYALPNRWRTGSCSKFTPPPLARLLRSMVPQRAHGGGS